MNIVAYSTIFLIPILFFVKLYKDYKLTKLKHEIIQTIDSINSLDKDELRENKNKYPEFYKVIKSIFNKNLEIVEFEQVEKSIKKVDKHVSEKINSEIELAVERKEIIEFIYLYRQLCILIYLYKNFNKYLLISLLMKVLPEKESKELKEREEEKANDLCLA